MANKIKWLLSALFIAAFSTILAVFLVAIIRTASLQKTENLYSPSNAFDWDEDIFKDGRVMNRIEKVFSESIRFKTISRGKDNYDREELAKFADFLEKEFLPVYSAPFVQHEKVNNYSLLFTVKGSESVPNGESSWKPYLLASHMDVVPADDSMWREDPWGGKKVPDPDTGEDAIWGRGTIDDKIGVIGILSALDLLILRGWKPKRTFYIAFGHDEEIGGHDGANKIAEILHQREPRGFEFLLDEGLMVVDKVITGVDRPLALIGVTEKGSLTLKLEVEGIGGHASIPPVDQVVGRLSKAVVRLLENPHPSMFGHGPEADMIQSIAPDANWPYNFVFSNLWLFRPLLEFVMSKGRETNAMLRTTTAVTIFNSGVKENVVPASAYAIVNHRVHPGQSLEDVLQFDEYVISDPSVKITVLNKMNPHPVSPYGPEVEGFRILATSIRTVFPNSLIVPSMMVANTDTQWYLGLTKCVYRFFPVTLNKQQTASIHGKDERLSINNLQGALKFYSTFIKYADERTVPFSWKPGHLGGEL